VLRWISIGASVIGAGIGVYAVSTADTPPQPVPLARPASVSPFDYGVAALGIVEPASREVGVVAPEPGVVAKVFVDVGDRVKAGDPLFMLDTRLLDAELIRARAAVGLAEAEIARWHALPRAEDVPALEAAVQRARAVLADREESLRATEEAFRRGSGNDREVSGAKFAVEIARADLARAEADLARLKAGGWEPDLALAQAALEQRRAEVQALTILAERLTVRAPRDGVVLRRSIEAGESAGIDRREPALILGDLEHLSVRAQIDEEDIALVGDGARAIARTRGAEPLEVALRLRRIEPFARPKRDLMGDNLERVDTRVIDVLFDFAEPPSRPVYPGQAMDVFVEARARR
jgi:HlyD family secretion protein